MHAFAFGLSGFAFQIHPQSIHLAHYLPRSRSVPALLVKALNHRPVERDDQVRDGSQHMSARLRVAAFILNQDEIHSFDVLHD
jgi:hypothetical protein